MKNALNCLYRPVAVLLAMILLLTSAVETAALRQTTTIVDLFDAKEYLNSYDAEIWSQYGTPGAVTEKELQAPGHAFRFNGKGVTGETVVAMTDWYWEIHSCSFDLKVPADADWLGLDFVDIDEPIEYCGDFGKYGRPMCYESFMVSPKQVFGLGTTWTDWGFRSDTLADEWISVKFVTDSAQTAQIYIAPRGKSFDPKQTLRVTLSGKRSFYNSAVVFADYKFSGYMIDNLVIETDTGTFKENFEDGKNDLLQTVTILQDTDKFSFDVVEDGGSRKLAFQNAVAGDRLIANTKLLAQDKNLKADEMVLSASFTPTFPSNGKGEIAYLFGLPEYDAEPFFSSWGYVMSATGGKLVRFDADGKQSVKKSGKFISGLPVNLLIRKNGTLTVTQNDKEILRCTGVDSYAGYTGFAAFSTVKNAIYIDDVSIKNQIYHVITTKTVADDFSTNRLGTVGNSDYAYYAEGGTISVEDGELVFDSCVDNTYFGTAYEYETYEMTFKLTGILATEDENESRFATYADCWIGFDFGKRTSAIQSYGSYGMLAVRVRPPRDIAEKNWSWADTFLYKTDTSALKNEQLVKSKPIPASLFKDIAYDGKTKQKSDISPDAAVCFKVVALGDRVDVYLKRADQKKYTLYVSVENANPMGYSAIACTGFTYWSIDDFEMKNTAPVYDEAPEVIIKEVKVKPLTERGIGIPDNGFEEEQKLNHPATGKKSSFDLQTVLWAGGIAVVVIGGAVLGWLFWKKKRQPKKKGGLNNEK